VAPARRPRIVVRECAIAFLLLLLFMFFGRHFLAALQLTEVSLRIGGSVILLIIAIRMIFPHPDGVLGRSGGRRALHRAAGDSRAGGAVGAGHRAAVQLADRRKR
jgi:small neutral amino acid transporter SnatA (MarC family)